ncbi:MAG: DUF4203 domain-containing protein [Acidobacteria bacterium]|nr:DUF4203 domain-containing protein [Acidobacteriota bacterium]
MLPLSIQVPVSVVLLAGGAIACFAGFRLFRLVLGVYGFILGALVGSSMVGTAEAWTIVIAALAGGAVGALVLVAGCFVGVALVGAGLGAFLVNLAWKPFAGDPHWLVLLLAAAVGGITAMAFQRYVIIAGTAFAGAWTLLVGAAALMQGKGARAASASGDVWIVYPSTAGPPGLWVYIGWIVIAIVGVYVQLHTTTPTARKKKDKNKDKA